MNFKTVLRKTRGLPFLPVIAVLIVLFQNCSGNFASLSNIENSSLVAGAETDPPPPSDVSPEVPAPSTPTPTPSNPTNPTTPATPTPTPVPGSSPLAFGKCSQGHLNLALKNLKLSSVQASRATCLTPSAQVENATIAVGDCRTYVDSFDLILDNDDCSFKIKMGSRVVFEPRLGSKITDYPYCLAVRNSALKFEKCAADSEQKWTISNATAANPTLANKSFGCLSIKPNAPAQIAACSGSDSSQTLAFVDPANPTPQSLELNSPISTNYWDTQGSGVLPQNLSAVLGFKYVLLPQASNAKVLELNAADSSLEFDYEPVASGLSILNSRYAAASAAGFDVYQDGVLLGRWTLRPTRSADFVSEAGGGFLVKVTKGVKSRYKLVNKGVHPPFRIHSMRFSPPISTPMTGFGLHTEISATGVTVIKPTQVSDSYRLPLIVQSNGIPVWNCPWSYCLIEYKIKVLKAGKYDLSFDAYSVSPSMIEGRKLVLDDVYISTLKHTNGTNAKMTWTLELSAGDHYFRLWHPGVDLGEFANSVTSGDVYFTPKF